MRYLKEMTDEIPDGINENVSDFVPLFLSSQVSRFASEGREPVGSPYRPSTAIETRFLIMMASLVSRASVGYCFRSKKSAKSARVRSEDLIGVLIFSLTGSCTQIRVISHSEPISKLEGPIIQVKILVNKYRMVFQL